MLESACKIAYGVLHTQIGGSTRKERKITFGLEITLERRLAERSSSTASENPVPIHHDMKFTHCSFYEYLQIRNQ